LLRHPFGGGRWASQMVRDRAVRSSAGKVLDTFNLTAVPDTSRDFSDRRSRRRDPSALLRLGYGLGRTASLELRMISTRLLAPLTVFASWAVLTTAAATLSPENAKAHVGETATVCGVVASTKYTAKSRHSPRSWTSGSRSRMRPSLR
jgi:hypothetical protein